MGEKRDNTGKRKHDQDRQKRPSYKSIETAQPSRILSRAQQKSSLRDQLQEDSASESYQENANTNQSTINKQIDDLLPLIDEEYIYVLENSRILKNEIERVRREYGNNGLGSVITKEKKKAVIFSSSSEETATRILEGIVMHYHREEDQESRINRKYA